MPAPRQHGHQWSGIVWIWLWGWVYPPECPVSLIQSAEIPIGAVLHIDSMYLMPPVSTIATEFYYSWTSGIIHVRHDVDLVWYAAIPVAIPVPTNLLNDHILTHSMSVTVIGRQRVDLSHPLHIPPHPAFPTIQQHQIPLRPKVASQPRYQDLRRCRNVIG